MAMKIFSFVVLFFLSGCFMAIPPSGIDADESRVIYTLGLKEIQDRGYANSVSISWSARAGGTIIYVEKIDVKNISFDSVKSAFERAKDKVNKKRNLVVVLSKER